MSIFCIFACICTSYAMIFTFMTAVIFPEYKSSIKNMILSFFCLSRGPKEVSGKQDLSNVFNQNECPICLASFEGDLDKIGAKCGHLYCITCITQYLKSKKTMLYNNSINCPICRKKVSFLLYNKIDPQK